MTDGCGDMVDTIAPLVAIASPKAGDVVARKSSVSITVTAGDDSGSIAEVVVFVNSESLCRRADPPFRCSWKVPAPPGREYLLQASARDASGNVALSPIIRVTSHDPVSREMPAEEGTGPEALQGRTRAPVSPPRRMPWGPPEW